VRPKGQITIPGEVRKILEIEEGDELLFSLNDQGQVVVSRLEVIPADEAWFWTKEWQQAEREAQEDIQSGRIHHYTDLNAAIEALEKRADAGN
jgi:AbrB family looped-hinge helix DNA binding protein